MPEDTKWCRDCAYGIGTDRYMKCSNPNQSAFDGVTGNYASIVRIFDCKGNWWVVRPVIVSKPGWLRRLLNG